MITPSKGGEFNLSQGQSKTIQHVEVSKVRGGLLEGFQKLVALHVEERSFLRSRERGRGTPVLLSSVL
jgi:hypothetical protein